MTHPHGCIVHIGKSVQTYRRRIILWWGVRISITTGGGIVGTAREIIALINDLVRCSICNINMSLEGTPRTSVL
jgi:hypothetical protein